MKRLIVMIAAYCVTTSAVAAEWFEALKASGDDKALYGVLHAMPKGGDLHNHNSGSVFSEDWLDIALAQEARGYVYYTKVRINNCRSFADADRRYLMLFRNILEDEHATLSKCEQDEYVRLQDMDGDQKSGWLNSIRLDRADEGREAFFETHWQRLNALTMNPYVRAEALYRNAKTLADEGAIYLETQVATRGAMRADGTLLTPDEMVEVYRERMRQPDAASTGITVRLQLMLLRFTPDAEDNLRILYQIARDNSDVIVALNMAGREDNDKGYPRRFLDTLRELRRDYDLPLAIHAGEVDEPNDHVRDTLLIGADRIGHGLNLITDDELMLDMRYGPYLVEINLISNLLLEYVSDYSQHPFPEYLRTGIPVALSTDDRGMWDSTLTDEFFVAVREFDLSWDEVVLVSRNSLQYALADSVTKARLMKDFDQKIRKFEQKMRRGRLPGADSLPDPRMFICARYGVCQ